MIAWCGNEVFLGVVFESKNENTLRRSETRFLLYILYIVTTHSSHMSLDLKPSFRGLSKLVMII